MFSGRRAIHRGFRGIIVGAVAQSAAGSGFWWSEYHGTVFIEDGFHAIPWASLDYEKDKGGYVVPFSEKQLKDAPAHSLKELTKDDGKAARDSAFDYYKVERYWVVGAD